MRLNLLKKTVSDICIGTSHLLRIKPYGNGLLPSFPKFHLVMKHTSPSPAVSMAHLGQSILLPESGFNKEEKLEQTPWWRKMPGKEEADAYCSGLLLGRMCYRPGMAEARG